MRSVKGFEVHVNETLSSYVETLPYYNSLKIMLNVINTADFYKAIRPKSFNPADLGTS